MTELPHARVAGVHIEYSRSGDTPLIVAHDFHLEVGKGQLICLAGRSGSGKTSILRVLAGLQKPTKGIVEWQGNELHRLSEDEVRASRRRFVGYLDQQSSLIDDVSVLENITLPVLPDGRPAMRAARSRAKELLEKFGILDRAHYLPSGLSGGERQRAGLARALIVNPLLVIVDEPTASLDRVRADSVVQSLRDYVKNGASVIAASHDPAVIDASDLVLQIERIAGT